MNLFRTGNSPTDTLQTPIWIGAETNGIWPSIVRRHPGVIVDPRKPQAGRIVVPVNALVGVNRSPEEYRWLREHFTPVDQIAYSFLVYDVPKEMLQQVGGGSKAPKITASACLAVVIQPYGFHLLANNFAW